MELIFMLVVALVSIITIFLLTKTNKSWFDPKRPRGENGWPLLGETLEFVSNPAKFIHDRMSKHSPDIFQTSIAMEKIVIFCGASGNKFIYSNEAKFRTWLPRSIAKGFSLIHTDSRSPSWRLFHNEIHHFFKLESMQDYVRIMDVKAKEHLLAHWLPYNEVKVQLIAKGFVFSLACHLFVGCKTEAEAKELALPYYTLAERLLSVPVDLPGTPYNQALKASNVVQGKLLDLIKNRKAEILLSSKKDDDYNIHVQDLLTRVLITAANHQDFNLINDEELVGHIIALLFAGFNTTSTIITFVLAHLAEYPQVYAKVLQEQLEIAQSKEKGELLTMKDTLKMKYTWNVVCESMRLKAPAIGGFREAVNDISYAGFTVPKGRKVHWNVYSTHMDPRYFPNPEKFDPSRFEEKLPPRVFVPFGGGSHMCCGKEFAKIETLVYIHNVVTQFRISKANTNEKIIYTPDPVSAEGLRILLHPHHI